MTITAAADIRAAGAWSECAGTGRRERVDVRDFIQATTRLTDG
ncbi:hypothetical protein OG806_02495 [Streptomyces sp. NBC_00882]|nr:hypothetical protein OG806_02495 [Streptomyces sp. NBC_00882]WSZ55412.1 hypothetical protein OH824_02065 [Streptomyces canus]